MAKVPTTLMIDEEILRAVKARSARTGQPVTEVIEEVLRRELGLDLLDRLWQGEDLGDEAAVALAVEAQHNTRRRP
jgi:ribbon-helix-helix CopG family protein